MADIAFHTMPDERKIAFRHVRGSGPAVVFLPGYMSDMAGSKATAVLEWARDHGRECLLLDYSGCGESSGEFAEGSLSRWLEEVLALIEVHTAAKVILVGSSMGGWLMLLAARALGTRVAALVGIAAAPDFTEWGCEEAEKLALGRGEIVRRDNPYGPEATPMHPGFWRDAQGHRQLEAEIPFDGPVRLLHGTHDEEVPVDISLRLSAALRSPDVQVTLIKGGDHRLSRDSDIALLLRTLAALT
jgi:pimeloyl-ACP methyl ester carboxylesterase